jgi:hypothetical protein
MNLALTLLPLGAPVARDNVGGGPEARARRLAHAFPNVVLRVGSRIVRAAAKGTRAEDELCQQKASLL